MIKDISLCIGPLWKRKGPHEIHYYSPEEQICIGESAALVRDLLYQLGKIIKPGINELDIDIFCENYIILRNAEPYLKTSGLYKHTVLISRNNKAYHGIPESYILKEGDIVTVDVVLTKKGWFGDGAQTYKVGRCDNKVVELVDFSQRIIFKAVDYLKGRDNLNELGKYIHKMCNEEGYRVIEEGAGHGIGRSLHEEPLSTYNQEPESCPLKRGMVFTIEPVITNSREDIYYGDEGTAYVAEGCFASQFEYMVAVQANGVKILDRSFNTF